MKLFLIIVAAWLGYSFMAGVTGVLLEEVWRVKNRSPWGGLRFLLWPIFLPAEFGAQTLPSAPNLGRIAGLFVAGTLVGCMVTHWPHTPSKRLPHTHVAVPAARPSQPLDEEAIIGPEASQAAYQAGLMDAAVRGFTDPRDCRGPGALRAYRAGCLSFVEMTRHRPEAT